MILDNLTQYAMRLTDRLFSIANKDLDRPFIISFPRFLIIMFALFFLAVTVAILFLLSEIEKYTIQCFTHQYEIDLNRKDEIEQWCKENCRFYYFDRRGYPELVVFFRKSDAVHFVLVCS